MAMAVIWLPKMAWVGRKWQKSLKIPARNAYDECEISKTVFKIFLAKILRKLQIHHH